MRLSFRLELTVIVILLLFSISCIEQKPERLEKRESPVSARLAAMVAELDSLSQDSAMTEEQLEAITRVRCEEVYRLMARALIREPANLYRAALILQRADESVGRDILLQAHYLAVEAAGKGHEAAKYVAAASLDRYLVSLGRPQVYGTQYYKDKQGVYRLYACDSVTTDSARAAWNVPPLDSVRREVEALNIR